MINMNIPIYEKNYRIVLMLNCSYSNNYNN